jgi:hypothetical protein
VCSDLSLLYFIPKNPKQNWNFNNICKHEGVSIIKMNSITCQKVNSEENCWRSLCKIHSGQDDDTNDLHHHSEPFGF